MNRRRTTAFASLVMSVGIATASCSSITVSRAGATTQYPNIVAADEVCRNRAPGVDWYYAHPEDASFTGGVPLLGTPLSPVWGSSWASAHSHSDYYTYILRPRTVTVTPTPTSRSTTPPRTTSPTRSTALPRSTRRFANTNAEGGG